ncbi:hypothetical protein SLE2022_307290 [Rubroshorea leprosula]
MAQISSSDLDSVDDLYFAALFDQDPDQIPPVHDDMYAEELQLQEALMSATQVKNPGSVSVSISYSSMPQPQVENFTLEAGESSQIISAAQVKKPGSDFISIPFSSWPQPQLEDFALEAGESSQTFCEICVERKEADEIFATGCCVHSFCTGCISKHVKTRVEESVTVVTCPGESCRAVLDLDACRPVLPKEVLDLWDDALCQKLIGEAERLYCPFKDCSAVLLNDNGEEVIRESECPFCHRLFCAQCNAPWHSDIDCEEFQKLNEDERGREDLMVRELAKEEKWGRCPHCKYYVERTEGCPHITCRCGFQFCYGCGTEWTGNHGGCQRE